MCACVCVCVWWITLLCVCACLQGGFARCYMFTSLSKSKVVAGKVVLKSTLTKERARQKLLAEIKIHRDMNHPSIVKFDTFFEDKTSVYILLELCTNNVSVCACAYRVCVHTWCVCVHNDYVETHLGCVCVCMCVHNEYVETNIGCVYVCVQGVCGCVCVWGLYLQW